MAARITDPEALHLFQILGAPMLAVIQAEAQAAQTSAEFIRRVGFQPRLGGSGDAAPADDHRTLQDGGELGDLKMAEFRIDRPGADGTPQALNVSMPVLSLFPIPLLQVKDAQFDFDLKVTTRVPLAERDDMSKDPPADLSSDFLSPSRVELKGFLTSPSKRNPGTASNEANIKVRVRIEQSDLPAGLVHLMRIMGDSVTAAPTTGPKGEATTPRRLEPPKPPIA